VTRPAAERHDVDDQVSRLPRANDEHVPVVEAPLGTFGAASLRVDASLTGTFFPKPTAALWTRHTPRSDGVEAFQSFWASETVRNTSASEPTFVTPSRYVNDGLTLAV